MAFSRTALFSACLLLAICALASGEIHRAKMIKPKSKTSGGVRMDLEVENDIFPGDSNPSKAGGHSQETWIYSLFSAVLVGLSGIFPLVVIPLEAGKALRSGAPARRLKIFLSFAVGGLLGDVFLHLLPEAYQHIKPGQEHEGHMTIGMWILAGILAFLMIEKMFPNDKEEEEEEDVPQPTKESATMMIGNGHIHSEQTEIKEKHQQNGHAKQPNGIMLNGKQQNGHTNITKAQKRKNKKNQQNGQANGHAVGNGHAVVDGTAKPSPVKQVNLKKEETKVKTSGWLNLLANVIDNFTHGLAVAGSYCISTKCGVITTVIILFHEVPHEIGDFAILLQSGFDRYSAAKAQILTASGGLLGALTALLAESAQAAGDRTAWILPFTSGGFIYVALVTVVPDLLQEKDPRESVKQIITMLLGISVMAFVAFFLDEHHLPDLPALPNIPWLFSST